MTDAQSLINENLVLVAENKRLALVVENISSQNAVLVSELESIKETLRGIQRSHFGTKSERYETEEQQLLFNEAEDLSLKPEDESESGEMVEVKAHTKSRGHRKPLPETLAREVVQIELPASEQFAEDGTPLKIIGFERSEKLKYEPARITVIEYQRLKYGIDSGDYEKVAPPVPSIIPKGIATPELLAAIVIGKYADGLPLYRMEEMFKRHGVDLPRQTMARWMLEVAGASQPLINVLNDRLLAYDCATCDETRVQVLKEKGRKAQADSWMIVRSTPYGNKKIVLFDYNVSRAGKVMKDLFLGFKGYLQVDGLNVYDGLCEQDGITRVGCNMHGRRGFEEAKVTGAKSGHTLAETGLKYYKIIYAIEKEIKELAPTPDERHRLRLEKAGPVWDQFKAWVEEQIQKVPKTSKIGEALNYFLDDYDWLTAYLKDGRLEPDNGFTERAIRKFAIGRNNWMFSDTVAGADASAVLYSLVVTLKLNEVNPYKALVKISLSFQKQKRLKTTKRSPTSYSRKSKLEHER